MDLMSIVGLFLGVALIVFSIMLVKNTGEGAGGYSITTINLSNFFDLPSIAIVVGGVIATLMLSFPIEQFARIPKHMRIIFMPQAFVPEQYIEILSECAKKARISGLLALEEDTNKIEDGFLRNSLQMVVDSIDPEKVKLQMESWMDSVDERHIQERAFYDKGAALAPAFGMIGTLIGLINMLKVLSDVESVGPNMAVALVTTFYGSCLANLFFIPVSNKLRVRHEEEYLCMRIVYEGVQSIQAGENPKLIREKLVHLLPEYRQTGLLEDEGGPKAESPKKGKSKK
ncbi:MAG: motility protein A [Clostridiales bacterium]|nr:motility protein A [Clostridiales bacterium]